VVVYECYNDDDNDDNKCSQNISPVSGEIGMRYWTMLCSSLPNIGLLGRPIHAARK